jgi:hypothetical protein
MSPEPRQAWPFLFILFFLVVRCAYEFFYESAIR